MDKKKFDKAVVDSRNNSSMLKKYLMGMVVSNVILVLALVFMINRGERVVQFPQVSPEFKMWVSKSQVSPEYLNVLSRNMLDLLLNITPNSVNSQQKELLTSTDPKYRDVLQAKLTEISSQLIQNNLSQNFYIDSVRVLTKGNIVYVKGTLIQYIDKTMSNSSQQTYKLSFNVTNYIVKLTNIELIPANDPQLREIKDAKK